MQPQNSIVFDLPDSLRHKADPGSIGPDERHFTVLARTIARSRTEVDTRMRAMKRTAAHIGRDVMERDFEIHRLAARARVLQRFGLDLCLGRFSRIGGAEPVFIGRLGVIDDDGTQLLIDWRSPEAEPFFGATHGRPMDLSSRRRYRWDAGRIVDYWDEVFGAEASTAPSLALDDQSAFIADLGAHRSPRMRDVLGTIAADQDAIVRASPRGALVVDGGPGTGKTVVALHRTAFLLYSQARLHRSRGGVLFVGPHEPYLAYVCDVLPSLGEDGVRTCTVAGLLVGGESTRPEADTAVARLKSSLSMLSAIESAVVFYEQPPTKSTVVETEWGDVVLGSRDWREAFSAADPATPHNEAREDIWELLLDVLVERLRGQGPTGELRDSLRCNDELRSVLDTSWTIVDAADLVADLWSVPAYLRLCAPWLSADEVRSLQRPDPTRWTDEDIPLIDAARARLGNPAHARLRREREHAIEGERARMDRVVDDLVAADDDEMMAAQLRQDGIRDALVDHSTVPNSTVDPLAGPFGHIVVDEAQELTDMQWQMLLRRSPSRSFTIVGDRAQARHGFAETWRERLTRVGLGLIEVATLTVNYRTPREVMAVAEPVIRAAMSDANIPTSVRSTGVPVAFGPVSDLHPILDEWLSSTRDGIACVIGSSEVHHSHRVRSLTPQTAKGLEFDLVVLVEPESFGHGMEGAVDRYVAMTRATRKLVVLSRSDDDREWAGGSGSLPLA